MDHLEHIEKLSTILDEAQCELDTAVIAALKAGFGYQAIADRLGVSRQACWAYYHDRAGVFF